MERLGPRDVQGLMDFLEVLYLHGDLAALQARLVSGIGKLVPSEITVYFDLDPRQGRATLLSSPAAAVGFVDRARLVRQVTRESPLLPHYRQGRGSAVKVSDFVNRARFHRLDLYNEVYRPMGAEYQIAKGLPARPPSVRGIALHRGLRDFSERDRLVLNLLGPHLVQAYRNAEATSRLRREIDLVSRGVEALDQGLAVVDRTDQVKVMTARAREWLAAYLGRERRAPGGLPEPVARWIRHQEAEAARPDQVPAPRAPLVVAGPGGQLTIRLVADGDDRLLLLQEQPAEPAPESFAHLALSRRETEVLGWLARGKSNADIGRLLATSPRTVDKHLEHIYRKLGVDSRTAALAAARAGNGRAS